MGKHETHKGKAEGAAIRRLKALALRRTGATIRDIAKALGVSSTTIHKDIEAALKELKAVTLHDADLMVMLQVDRLDAALFSIRDLVRDGNLKAIETMLKIEKQRADLLGLYAAPKSPVAGEAPQANTDKAVAEWRARASKERAKAEATLAAYAEVEESLRAEGLISG